MSDILIGGCVDATLSDLLSGDGCSKGGIVAIKASRYTDIDWDTVGWDSATCCITSWSMLNGAVFNVMTFDPETGKFDFVKAENTGNYQNDISVTILGKSKASWDAIQRYCKTCGLVLEIEDANCQYRVVGVGRNKANNGFVKGDVEGLSLVDHKDLSGTPSEKSRDELLFKSKSTLSPFYSNGNAPI